MVTYNQYIKAQDKLSDAQNDAVRAMRDGDQDALDAATERGAKYLAVIADYKDQLSRNAATLGRLGGSSTSKRKAAASRRNGCKGGRPRKIGA